jgi:hypothetical protein
MVAILFIGATTMIASITNVIGYMYTMMITPILLFWAPQNIIVYHIRRWIS